MQLYFCSNSYINFVICWSLDLLQFLNSSKFSRLCSKSSFPNFKSIKSNQVLRPVSLPKSSIEISSNTCFLILDLWLSSKKESAMAILLVQGPSIIPAASNVVFWTSFLAKSCCVVCHAYCSAMVEQIWREKCLKNHIPFDFWDDLSLTNQGAGKTIEKPLKELPWNQQIPLFAFGRSVTNCHAFTSVFHISHVLSFLISLGGFSFLLTSGTKCNSK